MGWGALPGASPRLWSALIRSADAVRQCQANRLASMEAADVTTNIEADTVTDKADSRIGYWLGLSEAAAALGVSERTLRRRVADGLVPNRMHQGRRQVRIDTDRVADTADNTATPNLTFSSGDNLAGSAPMTDRLLAIIQDDRAAVLFRQNGELRRAQRRAMLATATAVSVGLLAALWGVRIADDSADAQADAVSVRAALAASEGKSEALAEQVTMLLDQVHATTEREAMASDRLADMAARLDAARLQLLDEQRARIEAEAEARFRDAMADPVIPYRDTNAINNRSVVDGMRGSR